MFKKNKKEQSNANLEMEKSVNKNEEKIIVSSNKQEHLLKYANALYETKRENPNLPVIVKYFNCEIEIKENETPEMIADKIFLNLYKNLELIKNQYPEVTKNLRVHGKPNSMAKFFYSLGTKFDK